MTLKKTDKFFLLTLSVRHIDTCSGHLTQYVCLPSALQRPLWEPSLTYQNLTFSWTRQKHSGGFVPRVFLCSSCLNGASVCASTRGVADRLWTMKITGLGADLMALTASSWLAACRSTPDTCTHKTNSDNFLCCITVWNMNYAVSVPFLSQLAAVVLCVEAQLTDPALPPGSCLRFSDTVCCRQDCLVKPAWWRFPSAPLRSSGAWWCDDLPRCSDPETDPLHTTPPPCRWKHTRQTNVHVSAGAHPFSNYCDFVNHRGCRMFETLSSSQNSVSLLSLWGKRHYFLFRPSWGRVIIHINNLNWWASYFWMTSPESPE